MYYDDDYDYYDEDYDYLEELLEEAYLEGLYDAYLNEDPFILNELNKYEKYIAKNPNIKIGDNHDNIRYSLHADGVRSGNRFGLKMGREALRVASDKNRQGKAYKQGSLGKDGAYLRKNGNNIYFKGNKNFYKGKQISNKQVRDLI